MRVYGVTGINMVVARSWYWLVVGGEEEAKDGRRAEEVFHEDRWQFDEIGGTARSRHVLIFCSPNHGCTIKKGIQ